MLIGIEVLDKLFVKTFTGKMRGQMPATNIKFPREEKNFDSTKPDDQGIRM